MPKFNTWVVKLGGSLMHAPALREWLAACATRADVRLVVVVGGGPVVDEVRALQARWCFDDRLAHDLALRAMALNAQVAAALEPRLAVHAGRLDAAPEAPTLWLPQPPWAWLNVPEDWSVSADSVALALAQRIDASRLYLVKSVAPPTLRKDGAESLAGDGIVDACLPRLLRRGSTRAYLAAADAAADFVVGADSGGVFGFEIGT